ncbi:protein TolQ [Rhodobacteraceae bacterium NNCM2]|nr:protein TolQ [Coraliihabitans acroporae]
MAHLLPFAQAVGETAALGQAEAVDAVDFSVYAMFARATWVVKAVMILLVVASFWSWAIIFEKMISFSKLKRQAGRFEDDFWSGQPLDELFDRLGDRARSPIERIFVSGMTEWRRSFGKSGGLIPGTTARIDRAMNVAISRESEAINRRLSFLATVGSVSPFIGLFGTVWGIKHAFESIATQQNTNLAVVAPGIAEALLATALGLLAAIPAVIAYNRLVADAEQLTGALENFADEFTTILGRQIDRSAREED